MVSLVSWSDEVMHKTCCFDLYLFFTFLQGHENLEYFAHCTMNVVTLWTPQKSWFQQLAGIMQMCTRRVVFILTFSKPF